jgi:hypothetical protein
MPSNLIYLGFVMDREFNMMYSQSEFVKTFILSVLTPNKMPPNLPRGG